LREAAVLKMSIPGLVLWLLMVVLLGSAVVSRFGWMDVGAVLAAVYLVASDVPRRRRGRRA
jgi:hypothetical protein